MALPLVATKLYVPPQRPGMVARPRLLTRLGLGVRGRLTLISAPAGFGKTTLLASLAREDGDRAVAWLSLDAGDSDPTSFWTGVVTALRGAMPGVGDQAASLLAQPRSPIDIMIATLLNEMARAGEVLLVLDDYHLADGAGIAQGMTFLVEHLPPNARLVLSTRADPDLPLARWRARGELLEIRAADLRFTSDETSTYLSGATSARLTAEQVGALEDRTEGWIAALQLAAISLRRHDDVAGFIAGFAGDDRYVVDYLVEEVLAQQPPAVRDFLLRSAVLDRLCGPLCDAVVGTADAGRVLLDIERANLFLLALDDRRQWYRYHQLFSDVLRAHLVAEQPDLVPVLHRRASLWHEEHNLTDAAIMHALKAKDFDRAAFLMEMAVPEIRRRRQEAKVHGWLMALPEETVRRRPVLSVFSAALSMVAGDLDAVGSRLDDAERALAADNDDDSVTAWADTEELRTLPATIAIYRASLAQAHGDVADTVRHAQDALDQSGPHDHLSRGAAAGFLGLAAWADGEVSRALETFEQAVVSLHAAGNVIDELSGAVVLADLWRATGRPSTARELCEWALGKAEAHGEPMCRAAAELHVALSELDLEAGDLDSARRHLASAHDLIGRTPLTESHFRYFVASALVSGAEGDLEGAIAHLNRAEQLYRPGFFPDVRPIPAIRARVRIRQGRLDAASDWARERDVSTTGPAHYLREFDHLTLVRLLLVENRTRPGTDEVTLLLERLWENAETSGRAESLLEIAVLTALHHDAQGRRTQAMTALAEAFALAPEPEAHVRLFLDEGEPMVALLRAADQDGLAGAHPRRLLDLAANSHPRLPRAHGCEPPLADPLSDRELQVLGLLDGDLSGPQIAAALFISPNTLRTHTKHIFTKLGVGSRRAAVLSAHQLGLLPPGSD